MGFWREARFTLRPRPWLTAVAALSVGLLAAVACGVIAPLRPVPTATVAPTPVVDLIRPAPTPIRPVRVVSPTPISGKATVALRRYVPALESGYTPIADQLLIFPIAEPRTGAAPFNQEWRAGRSVSKWTHMPLFLYAPDGTLVEGVATGYEIDNNGLTYTVFLQPDAVFSRDGRPVTAADVKAAWELAARQPDAQAFLEHAEAIAGMNLVVSGATTEASGLEAINDTTLKITLTRKRAIWPLEMGLWLMGVFDAQQARSDTDWQQNPNGVGPLVQDVDDETAVTPSAHFWWDVQPRLQAVTMPVVPDSGTQLAMYERAQADVIAIDLQTHPSVYLIDNELNRDIRYVGTGGLSLFSFDTSAPPFDDMLVRAALAHAVDMEAIVEAVFGPAAEWARGLATGALRCQLNTSGYELDLDRATQLLASSTYGSAGELPPITIAATSRAMVAVGDVIVAQWRSNLGIEATMVRGRSPDGAGLVSIARQSLVADPHNLLAGLAQDDAAPQVEEVDGLALDDPSRCAGLKAAEQAVLDRYDYLPVFADSDRAYLVQPWVHNFETTFGDHWLNLPWMELSARQSR